MGLEVMALFADGMPGDAQRLGDAVNGRQVVLEYGRKWGKHGLGGGLEENEVVHPFNCWMDGVEFQQSDCHVHDGSLDTSSSGQAFYCYMLDVYTIFPVHE